MCERFRRCSAHASVRTMGWRTLRRGLPSYRRCTADRHEQNVEGGRLEAKLLDQGPAAKTCCRVRRHWLYRDRDSAPSVLGSCMEICKSTEDGLADARGPDLCRYIAPTTTFCRSLVTSDAYSGSTCHLGTDPRVVIMQEKGVQVGRATASSSKVSAPARPRMFIRTY